MMKTKPFKTNRFQAMRQIAKEYGNLPGLVRGYVHNGQFHFKISTTPRKEKQ